MSKTITLTIGERYATLEILKDFKGSIIELATILDDVKKIAITPEDWTAAGRVFLDKDGAIVTDGVSNTMKWNESDESTWKEIVLGAETVSYITKSIQGKSERGEITLGDVVLIAIQKKLA